MEKKNELHEIVTLSIMQALIILLKQKPLSKISVSSLCQKAGVSRVSFYRNFDSLEDVLEKYLKKTFDEWWENFTKDKTGQEIAVNFWEELLAQFKSQEELIKLLEKNNITHILKKFVFSCCGPSADTKKEDVYILSFIAGGLYGIIDQWIKDGMKNDLPKINMYHLINSLSFVTNQAPLSH